MLWARARHRGERARHQRGKPEDQRSGEDAGPQVVCDSDPVTVAVVVHAGDVNAADQAEEQKNDEAQDPHRDGAVDEASHSHNSDYTLRRNPSWEAQIVALGCGKHGDVLDSWRAPHDHECSRLGGISGHDHRQGARESRHRCPVDEHRHRPTDSRGGPTSQQSPGRNEGSTRF